jgi:hypothetical protein
MINVRGTVKENLAATPPPHLKIASFDLPATAPRARKHVDEAVLVSQRRGRPQGARD